MTITKKQKAFIEEMESAVEEFEILFIQSLGMTVGQVRSMIDYDKLSTARITLWKKLKKAGGYDKK